ncbi:MAG TPA: type II toxin-antitoxin system VapC family toxin [Candidatus Limnocylindrales bacterium]|nr:type II toxin-antitoxin system VapC family toxin [Candidatus Limnocylindrales bacterium]
MLFLDTSALVKRYVAEDGTDLVLARMRDDPEWVALALARTEAEITLCRLGFPMDEGDVWQRLRADWERCHVVPVDPACLERATEIGCEFEVRTLDALHLAAADRLPRPLVMLTFDQRQADAARSMDFVVEGA